MANREVVNSKLRKGLQELYRTAYKNGELWKVESYGRRGKRDTFQDVIVNIKKWLSLPSNIPMAKGDTNQVFAMGLWELNNP